MDYFIIKIGSHNIYIENIGNGFYKVNLNNANVGNILKRNGTWILQAEHPFTDIELQIIGTEIQNKFIDA